MSESVTLIDHGGIYKLKDGCLKVAGERVRLLCDQVLVVLGWELA